jgi:predicted RNase H-like HicB family nuclease
MAQYFGIVDGSGDIWGVRVPDLPGVHGGGKNINEAMTDTISGAREWAEHRATKGIPLPAVTPLDQIVRGEVQANEMIVNIPVLLDSGRPMPAASSLPSSKRP